jgi:hypothetical protein
VALVDGTGARRPKGEVMDAPYYNGSDDRDDLAADYFCADCGCHLYPNERERELCSWCFIDFLEHAAEDEQHEKDVA